FEIRNVAQDDPNQILERVLALTRTKMRAADARPDAEPPRVTTVNTYPGLSTADDSEAVALLASWLPPDTPRVKAAFGTEGGLFQQLWAQTSVLICGPGSIEVAHKADEYVELSQLEACDAMMEKLTQYLMA
ncbi:MAG: acetylornithine deacetylase, partial [Achromobacter kerstersii]